MLFVTKRRGREEVKPCASRARFLKEKARVKKGRAVLLSESESSIYEPS